MKRIFIETKDRKAITELSQLLQGEILTSFGTTALMVKNVRENQIEMVKKHEGVVAVYTGKIPEDVLTRYEGIVHYGAIVFNRYAGNR